MLTISLLTIGKLIIVKVMSLHHCIYIYIYIGKLCDASTNFQVYLADFCDITVDANPHHMVNKLVSADLFQTHGKENVKSRLMYVIKLKNNREVTETDTQ